jgi:hypothetical protein
MRRIANLPQSGGIDQMDIPLNKHGEGGFVAFDILFQPRDVIGLRHLPNYVRRNKIGTGFGSALI